MPAERRHSGSRIYKYAGLFPPTSTAGNIGYRSYSIYPSASPSVYIGKDAEICNTVKIPSTIRGSIRVEDCAVVYGKATLRGYIKIYDSAKVYGEATIGEGSENHLTEVYGNAKVNECAKVYDNARIHHEAHIYGHAKVFGNARVSGSAKIYDDVEISGIVRISGDTEICGKLKISGDFEIDGGIYFSKEEVRIQNMEEWKSLSPKFKCKDDKEIEKRRNPNPLAELE